jgi:DNA topoisomerase IB
MEHSSTKKHDTIHYIDKLKKEVALFKSNGAYKYTTIYVRTTGSNYRQLCGIITKHMKKYKYIEVVCIDGNTTQNGMEAVYTKINGVENKDHIGTNFLPTSNLNLLNSKYVMVTRHTHYDSVQDNIGEPGKPMKPMKMASRRSSNKRKFHYTWSKDLSIDERTYIDSLSIPPAWTPAHIFHKNDKVVWVAQDKMERWQWKYTDSWTNKQELKKIADLGHMNGYFWKKFHKKLNDDIQDGGWTVKRLAAIASKIMFITKLRPGWIEPVTDGIDDEEDGAHFGLITMQNKHVDLGKRRIKFVGKSGKTNISKLKGDTDFFSLLTELKASGNDDDLFFAHSGIKLTTNIFSRYLKKLRIKPKQFRTYFANSTLIKKLLSLNKTDHGTESRRKRNLKRIYKKISDGLNNTPKMAEKSYVFSGFPALYLKDPNTFLTIAEEGLSSLIKYFDGKHTDNLKDTLIGHRKDTLIGHRKDTRMVPENTMDMKQRKLIVLVASRTMHQKIMKLLLPNKKIKTITI